MAISLYSGTPGSYKSYHATADIISWLRSGNNVIANFPVNTENYFKRKKIGSFTFVPNSKLTVNYLLNYAKLHHKPSRKAQTLVVIDEASIMFNARQFDKKDRMEWVNFFANHRHFNYEFILIAQNDRMLDRQIRGLLEYDYKHRALKNWNLAFGILAVSKQERSLNALTRRSQLVMTLWRFSILKKMKRLLLIRLQILMKSLNSK